MQWIKRVLLMCMALMLCIPAAFAQESNLLINGGFEIVDEDGMPTGWYTESYMNLEGVSIYGVTEDAYSGSYSVTVQNADFEDSRFAQTVKVEPDAMYRLSGYIRADEDMVDSGRGANLSVAGVHAYSDSVFSMEDGWQYVEMYGETGEDQTTVTVFARIGGYSRESLGKASFDDLSLVKVDSIPEDAQLQKWYQSQAPVVIHAGEEELAEEEPSSPFWPWLIVLSALYAGAALWLMRWTQLDRRNELNERGKRPSPWGLMPGFVIVGFLLAAAIRVVVAFKVEGYGVDVSCFTSWGNSMLTNGPHRFYGMDGNFALRDLPGANWCDYPPAYLYVMAFNDLMVDLSNGLLPYSFAHKLLPMTCDLMAAWLVYVIAVENGCNRVQGGWLALLVAFNPAIFLNSAAWCQIDSTLCFGLMLVAYLAVRRRWMAVMPVYVLCVLIKPQALMLGFLGLAAIIRDLVRHRGVWKQMLIGVGIALGVAVVIIAPFCIYQDSALWLFELYGETLSSYPYATVNTTNLYYLFSANWQAIEHTAHTGAIVFFILISAAWGVYTFLRRKPRKMSVLEPVLTAVAALWLLVTALTVLPLAGGQGIAHQYPLYIGSWRIMIPTLAMLILSVLLLGAMILLTILLIQRKRPANFSLAEPVLMLLFTLTFALMLVGQVSWTELGIASMAMAFAVVLPMYIRSDKKAALPLCGAVLFLLLYVLGVKMHERYLFPAIFLFAMAYAYHRDRRILLLLVGTSCVLFINEGIILDNDLRLEGNTGHLLEDTVNLAMGLSALQVMFALASVWICHRICVEDSPIRLREKLLGPFLPVRTYPEKPASALNYKPNPGLRFKPLDAILMFVVTAVYAVVTLTTLGSTKAPQTAWKSTARNEQVIIDLGQEYEDFSMLYFCQVSYNDFYISVSQDGDVWTSSHWAQMDQGQCFRWKYVVPAYEYNGKIQYTSPNDFDGVLKLSGRYVCLTPNQVNLTINELIFKDAQGNIIPATIVGTAGTNTDSPLYSDPQNLLDEQDTLEGEPGWWNSTYFDEIYHARTAFEHMNGTTPYETSHPPLGKVIMSWFVSLFGMTPFGWRFAGALCGILMLPAIYLLAKQLTKKTSMAFFAMALFSLDCMHFTQTRIATIDSFPVLFIILSYFFMLRFMQRDIVKESIWKVLPDLALSGFFMGCGIASKWIGVYAGAGLAILYFWTCFRHQNLSVEATHLLRAGKATSKEQKEELLMREKNTFQRILFLCLWCLLFFVLIPVVIYLLSYIPYFAYRDFESPLAYLEAVIAAQESMLAYHGTPGLGMDHPFYSPWYEWLFMQRPMYYASPAYVPEGWSYAIFCFGNPLVWFVGLAGIAAAVIRWGYRHRYKLENGETTLQLHSDRWGVETAFVLIGLLAQFLPWVLVPRGTYIYHYFASVPFLILGTTMLMNTIRERLPKTGMAVMIVYLCLTLAMFAVLFPYASGLLTPTDWLDFIKDYPWIQHLHTKENAGLIDGLTTIMERVPLFPYVYY